MRPRKPTSPNTTHQARQRFYGNTATTEVPAQSFREPRARTLPKRTLNKVTVGCARFSALSRNEKTPALARRGFWVQPES